jgi:hypothetical protein
MLFHRNGSDTDTERGMKSGDNQVRAKTQMLRLDSELWEQIRKQASGAGKTPRQEIEHRLRESLRKTTHGRLSPARALSRLIELLAADVTSYCQTADEWLGGMKAGNAVLLNELLAGIPKGEGGGHQESQHNDHTFAESVARTLAQKVLRAHLPRKPKSYLAQLADSELAAEMPSTESLRQDELLRIQQALGLSPDDNAGAKGKQPSKE